MRSSASLALLLAAPLLACFSDRGSTTFVTSAGVTTGGSEPGSSGEPGTTQASTDTSTGAPTTDAPSTGMVSTGVPAGCELSPECQAGAVETGAQCDSCGVMRRTCQADCAWTPMTCEQDLATCAYWRLPMGAQAWERVPLDPAAMFAPKEPVLAVFAVPPRLQIYVLTGWGHLGDVDGWIPGDVMALCPDWEPAFLYGYNVSIGDGFVYPQDIGYCFDVYAPVPFDQFLPFTYAGRPANDLIAGAAWVDGLWIFR